MANSALSVLDRFILGVSLALVATSVAMTATGVAMFWGPMRQVLCAPVVIAIGVAAYVAARTLWWTVKQTPMGRS